MFTTSLEPNELLVKAEIPILDDSWRVGFEEFSRRSGDFALAMAIVCIKIDNNSVSKARISIGSVASTPFLCPKAANLLEYKEVNDELLIEVSEMASEEVDILEDLHASYDYKKELVKVMTYRALKKAFKI